MFKKKNKEKYSEKQLESMIGINNKKAKKLLEDEKKMDSFLSKMERKLNRIPKVGKKLADIPIAISLIRSYIKKEYNNIPLGSIIVIISTLIYFFSPVDAIPDVMPFAGYIDDISLVGYMVKLINDDLDKYKKWRDTNCNENDNCSNDDNTIENIKNN